MSREIDERVVQMQFDSKEFNKNIQTSIDHLDSLKKGLDFEDSVKGFDRLDKAARDTDIGALGKAVEQVQVKFGMLEVFALRVMTRISDAAINAGERLVKSLTIDQVTPGWEKYAQKTSSVQTIMAATAAQFSDTAEQMEVVNNQLDKLNWFTDETSYNFVDMVNNIGKFTSNNIALDQSVTAMQGIANWAAISGANAQEASRAMYNLAQALATGTVKLIDWKSIENANMATTEFKQTVIDIATELGNLKKVGEDTWTTIDGKQAVSVANFNEGLSKGWFTNDVLMRALNKYGAAAEKLNEIYERLGSEVTTSRIVSSVEKYTAALSNARAEAEKLGLGAEETNKKVSESGQAVAKEVAESWGVSLEEATEMLAVFDDETMQFGLKAFKAAQEAKTFGEAIDSVKDAVSTGWMKTFELLFGSYTEAKELWTNLANTLYDIFATSGDLRNEMLEEWAEEGGRKYFTDTIYASLAAIMSILSPIKEAWQAVFGTMTAQGLLDITMRLHDFVIGLVQTENSMANIARVFRGLFSVLDIIKTVITDVIKGGFNVLQRVFAELNIDIGGFVATLGDGLFNLRLWFIHTNPISMVFEKIGDAIIWVIRSVKDFINTIKEFGPVKILLDKLHSAFNSDFKGIGSVIEALGKIVNDFWNQLNNFKIPTSVDEFVEFFNRLGRTVNEAFKSVGIDLEKILSSFGNFGSSMFTIAGNIMRWIVSGFFQGVTAYGTYAVNAATALVTMFLDAFNNLLGIHSPSKVMDGEAKYVDEGFAIGITKATGSVDAMREKAAAIAKAFNDVDWAGVFLVGAGVAIIATLWKMASALDGFAKSVQNVTGVGKAAKGAFDAINGYFTALKKNIQLNNLTKTAIAITALAISLTLLSQIEWPRLVAGGIALGVIVGALAGLTLVFNKLNSTDVNGKNVTATLMSIAGSVMILALALRAIPIDSSLERSVKALIQIIVWFEAITTLASIFAKPGEFATKGLLSMAASIFVLIQVMKSIGAEDVDSIYAAVPVVSVLMVVLALISRLAIYTKKQEKVLGDGKKETIKNGGAFAASIGIVLALMMLIRTIKVLGKMDPAVAIQGIILTIPVVIMLGKLFKVSAKAGKEASSAGKMMLFLSAGLAILIPVLKKFAEMDIGTLIKGGLTIAGITTFIMVPLVEASKFAGQHAVKAGLMILSIAAAIAILQLVIKTLGRVDWKTLTKGVLAVSAVILAFSVVVKALGNASAADEKTVAAMTKLIVIVGIISALVVALTIIDASGALKVSLGLAGLFVALGVMFKQINKLAVPKFSSFIGLTVIILSVGVIVGVLTQITTWQEALGIAVGLSILMVAVSLMIKVIGSLTFPADLGKKLINLGVFIAAISAIVAIMGAATVGFKAIGGNFTDLFLAITAVGEVIVALGLFGRILKGVTLPSLREVGSIIAFTAAMAAVVIAIGGLTALANYLNFDISKLLLVTTAIAELILAMGVSLRLISGLKFDKHATEQIIALGVITTIMGTVLGIIAGVMSSIGADMSDMIIFATGISEVVLAIGLAARIMGKADFKLGLTQAGAMSLLVVAIGGVLGLLSNITDPNTVLPLAIGMSLVSVAVGMTAAIISKFPAKDFTGSLKTIGLMIAIVAAMGLLMSGLSWLVGAMDLGTGNFETAAEILIQIGRGIGGFIGGIVGGFVEGVTSGFPGICDQISQGMGNLMPFFDYLHQLPGGVLELVGTLVAVVAAITAAQFISGLKLLPGIGQILALGSVTLVSDFALFGAGLKAFYEEIKDIDADRVEKAAKAVVALGTMETSMSSLRTIFNNLLGFDNFEKFGERLKTLGSALVGFAETTAGIDDYKPVEAAVACAETLVALEKDLNPKNGLLQLLFTGQDDLGAFGTRLRNLGSAMANFSESAKKIDQNAAENARKMAKSLVDLEAELQPGWSIGGLLFGTRSLSSFGTRILQFIVYLNEFSKKAKELVVNGSSGVTYAVTITKRLSEIEKEINPQGGVKGFWLGDGSFASFGSNLKKFGESLVSFSNNIASLNFNNMQSALDYIWDLLGLQNIDQVTANALAEMKNLIDKLKDAVNKNEKAMRDKGSEMMKWIVEGLKKGIKDNNKTIISVASELAKKVTETFEQKMKIGSPSLVMAEEGKWVVKGLAEGITNETSAEDAIAKKAQNLVSAFESEFSKFSRQEKTSSLELELWKLTEGKDATEVEIAQKQLELENQKLANLAKTVGLRRIAMEEIAKLSGENSTEYQQAYQEYLQAQIDMLKQQNAIDEKYGATSTIVDPRVKMVEFANYMKEYADAYKFLGKTQEELELAAYKAVYGLDEEAVGRKRLYEQYMEEYRQTFELLGETTDALDAFAKEKSGWAGFTSTVNSIISETSKIIEDNLNFYIVDMEDTLRLAEAEIIESSKELEKNAATGSSASKAARSAGSSLGSDFGAGFGDGITESISKAMSGSVISEALEGQGLLDNIMEYWTGESSILGFDLGNVFDMSWIDGAANGADDILNAIYSYVVKPAEEQLAGLRKIAEQYGVEYAMGFAKGVKNIAARQAVENALQSIIVSPSSNGVATALQINSPSRLAMSFGRYYTEGFAIGIQQKRDWVDNAVEDLISSARDPLYYAAHAIEEILSSDEDYQPVITPVLDMDQLKSEASGIPSLLNNCSAINVNAARLRVGQINADRSDTSSQNGSKSAIGQTNYNFTQNNYSPKALSRAEIYRQTNNQFSRIKEATKR